MSEIKVLGVSGSPRKGRNTERLLQAALNASQEIGGKIELVSLADLHILPCNGCNACIREKKCPLDPQDDMEDLRRKLVDSDAIIFSAPSYFGAVPGIMKNMIDRSRPLKMDNHRLKGKIISALSLSGLSHGGAEQVAEAIIRFGLMHGMIVVGGCGDPLTSAHFGIASLQSEGGWRLAGDDSIAINNAREVGSRVTKVAGALEKARD